jgi:hypothetical protein
MMDACSVSEEATRCEFQRLLGVVASWGETLAMAPPSVTILLLSASDEVRREKTVTNRIVSRLPGIMTIDMFGPMDHDEHGFAIYTPFSRDALHTVGEELDIPQLFRDRGDLRLVGCRETKLAFERWGIQDCLRGLVQYPCWWGIKEHQEAAYDILSKVVVNFLSREAFAALVKEQRSEWANEWWSEHPERRDEMSEKMLQWWSEHPERRDEMSEKMLQWWSEHPERRDEMSEKMLQKEAECAPGSCSFLHADPSWSARFREATSERWREDAAYREHMMAILRQERPKMQHTMKLKWQDPAFRKKMLEASAGPLLEARAAADREEAARLEARFAEGSLGAVERIRLLRCWAQREKGRIKQRVAQPTHVASDALVAKIDAFYAERPGQREADERLTDAAPEETEARRLAAEQELARRTKLREEPRELDAKRSAAVKRGWDQVDHATRASRTSHGTSAANRRCEEADRQLEAQLLAFREGRMAYAEEAKAVHDYQGRLRIRAKQGTTTSLTPNADRLAQEILAHWDAHPELREAGIRAGRQRSQVLEATEWMAQFRQGALSAKERWTVRARALGRVARRKTTASEATDPPEVVELWRAVEDFYKSNPQVLAADRAAFEAPREPRTRGAPRL